MRREHSSVNRWIDETGTLTIRVPLLKNNKYPKKQLIYKVLWEESKNRIFNTYCKELIKYTRDRRKYSDMPKKNLSDSEKERLLNFIKDYSAWVSEILSTEGTAADRTEDKIKELPNKHKPD